VNKIKLAAIIAAVAATAVYSILFVLVASPHGNTRRPWPEPPRDAILVLGHSIDEYNQPSEMLYLRLQTALGLSIGHERRAIIIVSGGQGPTDAVSVGQAMKEWLIDRGVSADRIIVEDASGNTYENFMYSAAIAQEIGFRRIIVVTNEFHMFRAMRTANLFFDDAIGIAAFDRVDMSRDMTATMREPFSLVKLAFDHLIR